MNHNKDFPITPPDTSAAIGKLIVRLRRDGLISNEDVQRTLREALAPAEPWTSMPNTGHW